MRKFSRGQIWLAMLALFVVFAARVDAAVTPASLVRDHMVLQQGMAVPIWGTADAGEQVTVAFAGQSHTSTAAADGRWQVKLDPLAANASAAEMTISGSNRVVIQDVLVGEVWICSGQSNMSWGLIEARDAQQEIAAANYPQIRHFGVRLNYQDFPQDAVAGEWQVCGPGTAAYFSAVAYFFGRDLHRDLHVPIGLVHASSGGSYAEAWTSRPLLLAEPDFRPIIDRHNARLLKWGHEMETFTRSLSAWQPEADKAAAAGSQPPPFPLTTALAHNPLPEWDMASTLYNGMIAPLAPCAMRGVIWYQGESNAERAWQYRKLLPALIQDWRRLWGQGDFPFLIVQLCNHHQAPTEPGESNWAELREAQLQALTLANTAVTINIDLGEANNIHPRNKQDVGNRLSLAARRLVYGQNVVADSPLYESVKFDGGQAIVQFRHVSGGLVAKGGPLRQFAIAGADKKFVWADAKLEGNRVIVSSPNVSEPVAVRYAWADNPEGANLYNAEGLPAAPFRTDDWPTATRERR
jgi:sialate O-acetylesterase